MFGVRLRRERHIARNTNAGPARHRIAEAHWHTIFPEPFAMRSLGRSFAAINRLDLAFGIGRQIKSAAADARTLRFDDGKRQHGGNRRVGCAAAGTQYLGPSLSRAWIGGGNHAFGE